MSQQFWKKRKKPKDGAPDIKKKRLLPSSNQASSPVTFWSQRLTQRYLSTNGQARNYTISVAIPGSVIKNAQTQELRTHLVGQIARTIALYEVDEIVVFMDTGAEQAGDPERGPSAFFSRLLQYIEAPPYLRKKLFPMHNDLKFTGLLQPLDAPHHTRRDDCSMYREGIVKDRSAPPGMSFVDVGLPIDVTIPHQLRPGVRVTVCLQYDSDHAGADSSLPSQEATAVSPNDPREKYGLYWGFRTRLARSLGEVLSGCPFSHTLTGPDGEETTESGYDFMIGHTSSRTTSASTSSNADSAPSSPTVVIPERDDSFTSSVGIARHILLVFGGVSGLEACVEADEGITTNAKDTDTLFDLYWNCSGNNFGSRTLRTEEEVMISLTRLVPTIRNAHGN